MSSSYFEAAWQQLPPIEDNWPQLQSYRAHLPAETTPKGTEPEPLMAHIDLVNKAAQRLIIAHNLSSVYERLWDGVQNELQLSSSSRSLMPELLTGSVAFHDYGKLNEDFQADPQKMANPAFRKHNLSMGTSHAALSAYLYLNYYLHRFEEVDVPDEELDKMGGLLAGMVDPIIKHHNPQLTIGEVEDWDDQEMACYLPAIGLQEPANFWQRFKECKKEFEIEAFDENAKEPFPFYAAIKLTFSLLTAADYLATISYMYQQPLPAAKHLKAFGVLNWDHKTRWREAFRSSTSYNQAALDDPEMLIHGKPHDLEKPSNANLNQLRSLMLGESTNTIKENPDQRLFYLKAPTGSGKTNVSLAAVLEMLNQDQRLNKVYYVFPFTTLITQTYDTITSLMGLGDDELVELHSKAPKRQSSRTDDQYGQEWQNHVDYLFGNFPLTLLSHIRFFDILKNPEKKANYQLHRLANSVVVMDEIQSYPPALWNHLTYFITQFSHYLNIRFLIMSATLPEIGQLSKVGDPFINLLKKPEAFFTNSNFSNRVSFNLELMNEELQGKDGNLTPLVEIIAARSNQWAERQGEAVKVMVEFITKQSAANFLAAAEEHPELSGFTIMLLSGTILEPRRQEIISNLKDTEWLGQHPKVLLVCTQVVEAGVDLDMDMGFKDHALLDSDEQMAGRVNRNNEKPLAPVYLFQLDRTGKVYQNDKRLPKQRAMAEGDKEQILNQKAFDRFYQGVLQYYQQDQRKLFSNWQGYKRHLRQLDFQRVDREFQLIADDTQAVFIPISLPLTAFSEEEQHLLQERGINQQGMVDGYEVFELYQQAIFTKMGDFISDQEKVKKLQSLLTKFTINVFPNLAERLYQQEQESGNEEPITGSFLLFRSFQQDDPSGNVGYDYYRGLIIPESSTFEIF